jgi:DNA-directed RNA polymerase subunit RPC12/RpoP
MTSEIRNLVELKDIAGLEIDCHNCHAKFLYPLHNGTRRTSVFACPSCSEKWFVSERPSNAPTRLLDFMRDLETLSEDKDIYPSIRLSLAPKTLHE